MHDDVYVGRLLSGKYVGFPIARVPSASFNVLQFLQFPQINHRKRNKKSHARQITIGHSICFVLPCMDSNPFTAVTFTAVTFTAFYGGY
jgi:hypothetical protein